RGDLLKSEGPPSWRKRRFVFHNTYQGAVGGLHVVDAGSGPSRTFRVQLLTDFFVQSGFLRVPGSPPTVSDENRHVGGSLSLSYTPFDFIELYGSIRSHANSNATESPALFQVLGDTNLGLKGYIELVPWWILGLDVGVHLLNTVGDIGLVLDSTSLGFRLSTAVDLRAAEGIAFPFVARLNLRYFYDRSEALITGIERARYEALPSTGPDARRSYEDEDRHLLSRVERFALQINRMDFFDIGIGTEFPIEAGSEVIVSPIVEWVLRIPVNSRNYSCLWIPETPGGTTPAPGQDGCLAYQGFAAMPSNLTFALRVQPGIKGFALFGGADIGVSGQTFVRELAGNAPYNIYLGASYAVDTLPPPPQIVEREVERKVEVQLPPPPRGRIIGLVVDRESGQGIEGAVVAFEGKDLTALSAGQGGRFVSYELPPGEVPLAVSHPDYRPGKCGGTIPEQGGDVEVRCELEALPRVGALRGRVITDSGQPIPGASVQISGPASFTLTTDASGLFARDALPAGSYQARAEADRYLISVVSFDVPPRGTAEPTITLIARPRRSLVQLKPTEIIIRRQVNFATDSAEILPDSALLLSEVADVLLRHPEITSVEVQGHTDNRGGREYNMNLSQARAESVRNWLIRAGVAPERLTARGYGDTRPIAPNLTARGRARNRRVQFIITSRSE
ncbi:MAG: OmpA family protein, partial [Sandaracinaceae bacterium]|nr:OmpA family protein [Sandaracinaceae bacterium]